MNIIHQYVRDSKRQLIGVMTAIKAEDGILIGWSKCNKLDTFNKIRGLQIAIGRAETGSIVEPPRVVKKALAEFEKRAERYFNNPKSKQAKMLSMAAHTY